MQHVLHQEGHWQQPTHEQVQDYAAALHLSVVCVVVVWMMVWVMDTCLTMTGRHYTQSHTITHNHHLSSFSPPQNTQISGYFTPTKNNNTPTPHPPLWILMHRRLWQSYPIQPLHLCPPHPLCNHPHRASCLSEPINGQHPRCHHLCLTRSKPRQYQSRTVT